jgi:hypothetical protein
MKLSPRNLVNVDNAMYLVDEDVPNQRADLIVNRMPKLNTRHRATSHTNCTNEFWIHTCKKKGDLQQKCREYNLLFEETETMNQLAQKLADKFYQESRSNLSEEVLPETSEEVTFNTKQKVFL